MGGFEWSFGFGWTLGCSFVGVDCLFCGGFVACLLLVIVLCGLLLDVEWLKCSFCRYTVTRDSL